MVLRNSIIPSANVWISEGKIMRIDTGDLPILEGNHELIDEQRTRGLEGPYLNTKQKGCRKYLRHPNLEEMKIIFAQWS